MKSISLILTFLTLGFFANANPFICSTGDCGVAAGTLTLLGSAPTDGTTFYLVWYTSSASAPIGAVATPQPSATSGTASFGTAAITPTGGTNYTISIPATINANQNKPTVSNVDATIELFTLASFPSSSSSISTSFSTATALPVDFLGVNAELLDESVLVSWSTATEINNEIFVVQNSEDGENWNDVGAVAGAGNSNSVLEYAFTDVNPMRQAKSFYRIKQIDFDGNFEFSDVVAVSNEPAFETLSVNPNPATSNSVTVSSTTDISVVEVRNLAGKLVDAEFNQATSKLDISNLESGIYYLNVNGETIKLIK